MKSVLNLGLTFLFTLILFTNSFPAEAAKSSTLKNNVIELNLINGINSDNSGLKLSSINLAGDLKAGGSVIDLLKVFNSNANEKVRGAAALSLVKIGDGRGIKAIEYASRFDESQYVKNLCKTFYSYHKKNK